MPCEPPIHASVTGTATFDIPPLPPGIHTITISVFDPQGRPFRYNQRAGILNGDFVAVGDLALPWKEWLDG